MITICFIQTEILCIVCLKLLPHVGLISYCQNFFTLDGSGRKAAEDFHLAYN